jgi:hypothetical protein
VDDVLAMGGFDEIHIGLNDLHLSYGMSFMFELLADGTVEGLCRKFQSAGIPYGFGGIAKLGDGLLITELQGMHAGANPVTGDFSLAAKGFMVRGGSLAGAVNQITVAGNFYELLMNVEAVGGDLDFHAPGASCFGSPSLLIGNLSVAGA